MSNIKLFQEQKIRAAWNADEEEWYFSVVDVVAVLTDSTDYQTARKYWNKLKQRLGEEGSELVKNCHQLKFRAADGKMRLTDVLSTKGILRLIQSIPSPKAEPFKMWLAQVGSERMDEIADPEKAILRGADYYRAKGYSEGWINQRLRTIEIRKKLTDEWRASGVQEGREYAILTNDLMRAWSGLSVQEYKEHKGLTKENLRDNMTDIELILTSLAEITTTRLSQRERPEGLDESRRVAKRGGAVARRAREDFEETTGESAISALNAGEKELLETTKPDDNPEG